MTIASQPTTIPSSSLRASSKSRTLSLVAIFIFLSAWAIVFRWTGEGDSGMHFMNLREATMRPYYALYPWARPGYVVIFVWPAMLGLVATRLVSAAVTTLLCWQTMELADDLRLPRATLAGWLIVAQPFAFYLASDTMTELPFALFLLLAIRAWTHRHFFASFMLIGFLPLVRPEGFFLGPVWGVLALCDSRLGAFWKRPLWTLLMLHGLVLWTFAGHVLSPDHEWDFILRHWSWEPDSSTTYGRGGLLDHVAKWPYYCGPALLVLWIAGIKPSLRRGMGLPWLAWGVIFGVHSILWWGGWFGALGLMRIQTASAFTTAIVALFGWNRMAMALSLRSRAVRRTIYGATWSLVTIAPLAYYLLNPETWHFVNNRRATAYIREHELLTGAPVLFFSDVIATVDAEGWQTTRGRVNCIFGNPLAMLEILKSLPVGSVGTWDNQRGQVWHGVSIESLEKAGFEVLYDTRFAAPGQAFMHKLIPPLRKRPLEQRVVVLKRVRKPE